MGRTIIKEPTMSDTVGSSRNKYDALCWAGSHPYTSPALYITLILPYTSRSFNDPNNGINREFSDEGSYNVML